MRALLAALGLLLAGHAHAWGGLGHRVTSDVAAALLSDSARKQVQQLLGDESLAAAATFMDTHRDELRARWPGSPRWHYDNQPVCGSSFNYCADGQCATRQLEHWQRVLADRSAPPQERALALRLLVHMLGDIHQPLHMSDNRDRGGNDIYVRVYVGAERQRLHELFDNELVRQASHGQSAQGYAMQLLARYRLQLAAWQRGTWREWAEESHRLGVNDVYGHLPNFACNRSDTRTVTLSENYVNAARDLVAQQLAKAGMRIAIVLNTALH